MEEHLVIYSKSDCPNCDKAKSALLTPTVPVSFSIINCDEQLKIDRTGFMNFLNERKVPEKNRMFPFIFAGEKYIGGYKEILRYLADREFNDL